MKFKFLILALLTIIPSLGFAAVFGDFEYTVTDNRITIDWYSGSNASVQIPSQINNVPVTTIDISGCTKIKSIKIPSSVESIYFYDCSEMISIDVDPTNPDFKSVNGVLFNKSMTTILQFPSGKSGSYSIPKGVTTIGAEAFYYCAKVTKITIPNSVTTIEGDSFNRCTSVTSITIPKSVTEISEGAFSNDWNLTSINVDPTNPDFKSVNGVLFNKSMTTILQFPGGKSGSYSIPIGVTTIGEQAFEGSSKISSITIPSSVSAIGEIAFQDCFSLKDVTILNGLKSIPDDTFMGCTNLRRITIPSSVDSMGDAFRYCFNLGEIYFLGSPPSFSGQIIDECVVYYLPSATGWDETYAGMQTKSRSF